MNIILVLIKDKQVVKSRNDHTSDMKTPMVDLTKSVFVTVTVGLNLIMTLISSGLLRYNLEARLLLVSVVLHGVKQVEVW